MSRAPTLVLFDLGDVVAAYDPSPRLLVYAEKSGLDPSEVRRRLVESDFSSECDAGVYDADAMHAEIERRLACSFPRDELLRLQALAFTIRPEMLDLARELGARARVGMLTNNSELLEQAIPVHFPELLSVFDPILVSWRLGHEKADSALFAEVAGELDLAPGEILFIDDQARHTETARQQGWQALQFRSLPELRLELEQIGLVTPPSQ